MAIFLYFFFTWLASAASQPTPVCQKWFQSAKILSTEKECDLKCRSLMVDMNTFDCANQCEIFCKDRNSKNKCVLNKKLLQKIKNSYPQQWADPREQLSPFSEKERQIVINALAKLPDTFRVESLEGIYKLKASFDWISRTTPASYSENKIVLYEKAFSDHTKVLNIIVREMAHHLHNTNLKDLFKDYQKTLGWVDPDIPRPGPFFNIYCKWSPDEDFATNFENYILAPQELKAQVPQAFSWMHKHIKDKFKLKECEQ